MKITKLRVLYNGRIVGYLAEVDEKITFQYDSDWLEDGFSISPLSLPLKSDVFVSHSQTIDMFGVFLDSLPDGWGELLLRRHLRSKGISFDSLSLLDRLTLTLSNGLGALTYEPCEKVLSVSGDFDLDALASDCKKILEDESGVTDFDKIFKLGGSSGGARPKVHVSDDEGFWIVKFPSSFDPADMGLLEYNANRLARECGIRTNDFKLFKSSICSGYFGAKRFDKTATTRVHVVSLSAILETSYRIPNLDYIHLFQVVKKICKDGEEMYEAFRRMAFNVLYGNRDDHGKNFAFMYDEEKQSYILTPFFDITRTPEKAEHEMTVNGRGNPDVSDMMAVADRMNLNKSRCEEIIATILRVLKSSNQ